MTALIRRRREATTKSPPPHISRWDEEVTRGWGEE
jgi:hypothetical protein